MFRGRGTPKTILSKEETKNPKQRTAEKIRKLKGFFEKDETPGKKVKVDGRKRKNGTK